jgi:hypothetical protein
MNVPGQRRSFGTVPSLRQIVLGTSLFSLQTSTNEFAQSPLVSATSMAKSAEALLECELPLDIIMN